MCGFTGFIGYADKSTEEKKEILRAMMDAIIHRGPDSEGMFVDKKAAMGFRRLSIIDLDNGSQPMFNETKDIVITFNGEIYNHEMLRAELINKGHVFANKCDTEVIIHGYEEFGKDVVKRLRGMFAFVIYDMRKNTVFAARDWFGIKPFYYRWDDEGLVYSSEIKSILKFPGVERKLNESALEQYMSFQYSVLPETFFKDIYKLPAAHTMTVENGVMSIERYFDPMLEPVPEATRGYEKVVSDISALVHETVDTHMIADVEVGSLLSSGVDSSFVVSEFPGTKTYTVGFGNKDGKYNEIGYAEDLVSELGKNNRSKTISSDEYFDAVSKVMYYMDEPLADPSCVALYFVDKLAAEDIKVVLSGEGADEFFGGYNIYHEPLSLAGYRKIPRFMRKAAAAAVKNFPDFKGRDFMVRGSKDVEERFIGNANLFSVKEREKLLKTKLSHVTPQELTAPYYERCKGLDDIAKMQYIDINFWLQGDILLKADKMSMAHSLESRVPFLDKVVFNYAKSLPTDYKVKEKATKRAFREAAKKKIPQKTAEKKKLGFPVPIRVWLKEEKYFNMVEEKFLSDSAKNMFDVVGLQKLLCDHKDGKADNSRKIWAVYVFLVWYEIYIEGAGVKVPSAN